MAVAPSTLRDYSWEEIKVAAKQAMVTRAMAQAIGGAGKTVTFGSIQEAENLYLFAVRMQALESNGGGLGQFLLCPYGA